MSGSEKSLIGECEELAENLAEMFMKAVDEKTHNFGEYEFAYKLAFDTLKNLIGEHMP